MAKDLCLYKVDVTFDVNELQKKPGVQVEYTYVSSFRVARGDMIIVDTRYGPSLARVRKCSEIEVGCMDSTYATCKNILSTHICVPAMVKKAQEDVAHVVKEQEKAQKDACKIRNKIDTLIQETRRLEYEKNLADKNIKAKQKELEKQQIALDMLLGNRY